MLRNLISLLFAFICIYSFSPFSNIPDLHLIKNISEKDINLPACLTKKLNIELQL